MSCAGPCVYLLANDHGWTYIGATTDVKRRLRQHNGEICGGARRTSRSSSCWALAVVVTGFTDWRDALRFEYAWRRVCRRQRGRGVGWRKRALSNLLERERWSSTSPLAASVPLVVHQVVLEPLTQNAVCAVDTALVWNDSHATEDPTIDARRVWNDSHATEDPILDIDVCELPDISSSLGGHDVFVHVSGLANGGDAGA